AVAPPSATCSASPAPSDCRATRWRWSRACLRDSSAPARPRPVAVRVAEDTDAVFLRVRGLGPVDNPLRLAPHCTIPFGGLRGPAAGRRAEFSYNAVEGQGMTPGTAPRPGGSPRAAWSAGTAVLKRARAKVGTPWLARGAASAHLAALGILLTTAWRDG